MAAITQKKARTIIRAALAQAREAQVKPLAVVVLDSGGHLIAAEREDGATPGRIPIATAKAYGAVMLGVAGTALKARADSGGASFIQAANGVFGGRLVPVPGGVLIRNAKGVLLGAVGVSGDTSENDAAAALAGIVAAGFTGEI